MKKILLFIITASIFTFSSCFQKEQTQEKEQVIDTIPMMVMQIQKCNRLYTAEAHVHKIVTHDDQLNLKGSFFRKNFNIHVPGSNRKIAIPMNATIKASVDFQGFSDQNVLRKGDKIEIILPDPKLTLTSSKIDHNSVKQYVSITRSNYSDAAETRLRPWQEAPGFCSLQHRLSTLRGTDRYRDPCQSRESATRPRGRRTPSAGNQALKRPGSRGGRSQESKSPGAQAARKRRH